jgi:hypothetical protein
MGYSLDEPAESEEMRLWRRLMLAEACRVKEALFFRPAEDFLLTPPGVCRVLRADTVGMRPAQVTRDDLVEVLREGGFYAALTGSPARKVRAHSPPALLHQTAVRRPWAPRLCNRAQERRRPRCVLGDRR